MPNTEVQAAPAPSWRRLAIAIVERYRSIEAKAHAAAAADLDARAAATLMPPLDC
jgi:hypothetical protein